MLALNIACSTGVIQNINKIVWCAVVRVGYLLNLIKHFTNDDDMVHKRTTKVLRYFPLIPRLQRIFMSLRTYVDMTCHSDGYTNDGHWRHLPTLRHGKHLMKQTQTLLQILEMLGLDFPPMVLIHSRY